MEDPPMINAAGRPASLRRTPQHHVSIGRLRGPAVGHAAVHAWAGGAGVTGPGIVVSSFAIIPRAGRPPSRPARRLPW
jgi:hypothetical protein